MIDDPIKRKGSAEGNNQIEFDKYFKNNTNLNLVSFYQNFKIG